MHCRYIYLDTATKFKKCVNNVNIHIYQTSMTVILHMLLKLRNVQFNIIHACKIPKELSTRKLKYVSVHLSDDDDDDDVCRAKSN